MMSDKEEIKKENLDEATENIETANTEETSKSENNEGKKENKESRFFKKKDDKFQKQIAQLEETNAELKDKYLRLVAEYDNYRKRTAKEKIEISDNVRANLLLDFFPIVDDMDRALLHIKENSEKNDFSKNIEGVQLIADKFHHFLENYGISEIKAKGEDFDVDLHEAISRFPVQNENDKGKVIEVIQTGYKMNDKVVRFAKVVVGE